MPACIRCWIASESIERGEAYADEYSRAYSKEYLRRSLGGVARFLERVTVVVAGGELSLVLGTAGRPADVVYEAG